MQTLLLHLIPLLKDFQGEMEELSLALLSLLHHFQDGNGTTQLSTELQHLLIQRLIIFTILPTTFLVKETAE